MILALFNKKLGIKNINISKLIFYYDKVLANFNRN